ncbi:MAG: DUF6350 family protein [Bifidobacteriaceae bacterium]|jgi:hypothetical protein|nr:DUF6350 family protein [Bifidobacteriaceae bacterium]
MSASAVRPATRPAPRGPGPLVAGLLVGVQAALLSWIVVVVPTVAAFTATSALNYNAGVSWADAGRLGSQIWVLGHFGSMALGEGADVAAVSLSPLGIALLSVLACWALSHATAARGWGLVGGGLVGFLAVDAVIAFVLAGSAGSAGWAALAGGGAAAAGGLLWGNAPHNAELLGGRRRPKDIAEAIARSALGSPPAGGVVAGGVLPGGVAAGPAWLARAPRELPAACAAAAACAALVLAEAAALAAVAAVAGQARYRELFASLGADPVGGVALAMLGLMLAPNALAFAAAYLSGTGFAVGQGTWFSPLALAGGTEPALPVFGFLPATAPPVGMLALVAGPVLAGCVVGWVTRRRLGAPGAGGLGRGQAAASPPPPAWWRPGLAAVAGAVLAAAALAALVVLAGGGIGPGRMQTVGSPWWPLAGWLALELGGGAAVGSLLLARPWRLSPVASGAAAAFPGAGRGRRPGAMTAAEAAAQETEEV